jgi:hypothetical protein
MNKEGMYIIGENPSLGESIGDVDFEDFFSEDIKN